MGRKAFYIILAGIILSLLSLPTAAIAQAPVTLAGSFSDLSGNVPPNLAIQFVLAGCGGNIPQVAGHTSITQKQLNFYPDPTNGALTGTVWPNDIITCGTVTGGTTYMVTMIIGNIPQGPPVCYQILSTQNPFNLNSATPCITSHFYAKRGKKTA